MTHYLETFRYENSQFHNLDYHCQRVVRTIGNTTVWQQIEALLTTTNLTQYHRIVRFTIEYSAVGIESWRAMEYSVKNITRLIPIEANIDYHLKYADRSCFEPLRKGLCANEEPLIVQNGLVTDTTFANVVFQDTDNQLYTPRLPLLKGTRRAKLLNDGVIIERDISPLDLPHFTKFYLINAMRGIQ